MHALLHLFGASALSRKLAPERLNAIKSSGTLLSNDSPEKAGVRRIDRLYAFHLPTHWPTRILPWPRHLDPRFRALGTAATLSLLETSIRQRRFSRGVYPRPSRFGHKMQPQSQNELC